MTCTSQSGDGDIGSVDSLMFKPARAASDFRSGAVRASGTGVTVAGGRLTAGCLGAVVELATAASAEGSSTVSETGRDSSVITRYRGPDSPRPISWASRRLWR